MILNPLKIRGIFFILFICFFGTLRAQQNNIAEIDQLINTGKKLLLKPDSMIIYADKAYELSKQANYDDGLASALKLKGIFEYRKSNFAQAINYYQQGLAICLKQKNDLETGKAYLNIAMAYLGKPDYINTTGNALKALPYFEKLNDNNGNGRVLNLLGSVCYEQKQYKKANNYFFRYNALVNTVKDSVEIASSFNNIARTYQELKKIDSAIYYNNRSLAIQKHLKNDFGVSKNYQNLGELYDDLKDYKRALQYNLQAAELCKKLGDQKFLSYNYFDIGKHYIGLNDIINAVIWLKKSIDLAKKIGENEVLGEGYRALSDIQAGKSNYKTAYNNLVASANARDSVLNVSTLHAIEELKTKYETEKKQNQIDKLKEKTTLQQFQLRQKDIYLIASVLLLLAVAGIAYLLNSRRKAREQIRLQQAMNKQQEVIAYEVLTAEERERRRMGSDLHDGVGQLLSSALLSLSRLNEQAGNEQKTLVNQSLKLITESYDEIRTISHQIIPNALLKFGLSAAIRDFLSKIDEKTIKVSLEIAGINERLEEQTETILYRVIQETVTNVVKHANASKLSIQLVKDTEGINLAIEDNGKGFDIKKLSHADGIGMKNIYSRISFLKGIVDIQSSVGKGTLIAIFIPQ